MILALALMLISSECQEAGPRFGLKLTQLYIFMLVLIYNIYVEDELGNNCKKGWLKQTRVILDHECGKGSNHAQGYIKLVNMAWTY